MKPKTITISIIVCFPMENQIVYSPWSVGIGVRWRQLSPGLSWRRALGQSRTDLEPGAIAPGTDLAATAKQSRIAWRPRQTTQDCLADILAVAANSVQSQLITDCIVYCQLSNFFKDVSI